MKGLSATGIYNPDFRFRNMGFMFQNMPIWNLGFETLTEYVLKCNSLDNMFRNIALWKQSSKTEFYEVSKHDTLE